ncbi:MAG: preprotein translocase subunit SecG [Candidatus Omnitrophota bacterium]
MYTFVIVIHMIVSLLLITVILIQQGRGGGLLESISGIESLFGTKTNAFLTRTTAILATLFIITCLGLTFLSVQRSKSLMERTGIVSSPSAPQTTSPVQGKTTGETNQQPSQ